MDQEIKTEFEKIKEKLIPVLHKYRIKHAGIFGSVARGEINSCSDIDILVELPEDADISLFDLSGIEIQLEKALGRKVDLLTYSSIHPLLRDRILREEIKIA